MNMIIKFQYILLKMEWLIMINWTQMERLMTQTE